MANEYLQRTPTSTGNRRVWTWSGWLKLNSLSTTYTPVMEAFTGGNDVYCTIAINSNSIWVNQDNGAGGVMQITASPLHRDSSSWLHLLVSIDTTQTIAQNRIKIYVNGVAEGLTYTTTPSVNFETHFNRTGGHRIGSRWSLSSYINAEYTDVFLVDGQALTPDVFGFYKPGKGYISAGSTQATDFRNGQWVPRKPSSIIQEINDEGGFGVNGFYLPMNDSNNFGADFHCDPNSIITLNEKLPQPRVGVANTATAGIGFTDALRADPYAANLVLALPLVSGGLSSGFGDYGHIIRGSGSAKVGIITASSNVSIANTASYYGSAAYFDGLGDWINFGDDTDFEFGSGDFTIEFWRKRNSLSSVETYVAKYVTGPAATNSEFWFGTLSSGRESFYWYSGSTSYNIDSPSNIATIGQLDHIAAVRKGSVITLYLNGVAVGINTNVTYSLNTSSSPLYVGGSDRGTATASYPFNGYIQDLRIYKGVAKYTGGFDVPKPYTPVGITTWRAVTDTCQNNFATLNPLVPSVFSTGDRSISNGNLTVTTITTGNATNARSTIGVSTGRWYAETYVRSDSSNVGFFGITGIGRSDNQTNQNKGDALRYYAANGYRYEYDNDTANNSPYASSYGTGDIIGIAINANNGEVSFYKNGIPQGVAKKFSSSTYPLFIQMEDGGSGSSATYDINFGQNPTFSGQLFAGTYTDSNGKGLFKYQPPAGYLALCDDNLPTPAIADPGKHFRAVLYKGSGSPRGIVGVGFTPDLVWIKGRDVVSNNHVLFDSVRGAVIGGYLMTAQTNAEAPSSTMVLSFDNDGFSLGSDATSAVNNSSYNYVAWCWKGGGPAVKNTDGSVISNVSANPTAGFSVITWVGNGSAITVGHGLGKTPAFRIIKDRNNSSNWYVWHKCIAATEFLILNQTTALTGASTIWNSALPNDKTIPYTSTSSAFVDYVWAEVEGFSRFGSYIGNGSTDGPFVYCGFKPAWIMIKNISGSHNWEIYDSSMNPVNPVGLTLLPNTTDIQTDTTPRLDFLSNGFKWRSTGGSVNGSGNVIIFAAFAESPFNTANAK